jgi:hypothetical protein
MLWCGFFRPSEMVGSIMSQTDPSSKSKLPDVQHVASICGSYQTVVAIKLNTVSSERLIITTALL